MRRGVGRGGSARGLRAREALRPWVAFVSACAVTAVLVVVIGSPSVRRLVTGDEQPTATTRGLSLVADDARSPVRHVVVRSPRVRTVAASTTTVPPPGFGLLPAPPPTPVPLPPVALAPVFSRVPTTNKVIFLGIDDGLVRDPKVLDLLAQARVPFSIFLVQGPAHDGEDFWHQAQQLGGTVESHTITHPDLTKVSAVQQRSEICGTLDDYQTRFGRRPTLFRPPYGAYNDSVRAVAASCGFKAIIMWAGSTNDGRFDLQVGTQLQPGDIILMHWRTDLYQNLLAVFQRCRDQGFAIGRLEDYLT